MATLLSVCQGDPKHAAQKKAMLKQLADVQDKVQKAFDSLSDDEAKNYTKQLQDIVALHNPLFVNTPAGSMNNALINSGLTRLDRTKRQSEKNIESNGIAFINGKLYVIDPLEVSKYYSQSDVDSSQVLPGLTDETDSSISSSKWSATSSMKDGYIESCTGMYNKNGTVDQLRELLKAFDGDVTQMKRFVNDTWQYGVNVVWSMPRTQVVEKPIEIDTFDFDAVRELIKFPAYDEDINIINSTAYVYAETYVADGVSRQEAEARARDIAIAEGLTGTPALCCRVIRAADNEDIKKGTVSVHTSGFDSSKLSSSSYKLGLIVNGIKRVIDATGDKGTNAIFSEYTADIVASSINMTFGTHLKVTDYGGELLFTVASAGSNTSLEFFHAGSEDASDALGVNGLISNSINHASRVSGIVQNQSVKLDSTFTASWNGGKNKSSAVSDSLSSNLREFNLDDYKYKCVLSTQSYWDYASSRVQDLVNSIDAQCNRDLDINQWLDACRPLIREYERIMSFTDISDFRIQEAKVIIAELGNDALADLLIRRPEIDTIYLTYSTSETKSAIASLMQSHADKDSVVDSAVSSAVTIINPFRQNRSKLAYSCGLFNFIDENVNTADVLDLNHAREALCAYISSMIPSTIPVVEKSQHSSIGRMISTLSDDLESLTSWFGQNVGSLLMDPNAPSKVAAAVVAYACRQMPDTCGAISDFMSMVGRNEQRLISGITSAEDAVSSFLGNALDTVFGTAFAPFLYVIDMLSALVQSATKIVNAAKTKVTSFFQTVFNKPGESLPSILSDLANLSYNVYGDFSVKTKFMSCYASGSASAMVGQIFNKLFDMINTIIGAICSKVDAVIKAITDALAVIQCIADKLMMSFQGTMSYEMAGAGNYMAAGMVPVPVSFNLQCTVSYGYQSPDPGISRAIKKLIEDLNALGASLHLQTIKFNSLSKSALIYKSMEITQQTAASTLIEDLRKSIVNKLLSLLSC